MRKVATTPSKKFNDAKCEKCVHFWEIKETDKAYCTSPEFMPKTRRNIKNFIPCDFYEEN